MTDVTKTLLLGTDATGSSYHDLMRSVTVHSMRQAAGYVAKIAPESECRLPVLRFDEIDFTPVWVNIGDEGDNDDWYCIGHSRRAVLQSGLCWDCMFKLTAFYYPHFRLWTTLTGGDLCECCSDVYQEDDIPF